MKPAENSVCIFLPVYLLKKRFFLLEISKEGRVNGVEAEMRGTNHSFPMKMLHGQVH